MMRVRPSSRVHCRLGESGSASARLLQFWGSCVVSSSSPRPILPPNLSMPHLDLQGYRLALDLSNDNLGCVLGAVKDVSTMPLGRTGKLDRRGPGVWVHECVEVTYMTSSSCSMANSSLASRPMWEKRAWGPPDWLLAYVHNFDPLRDRRSKQTYLGAHRSSWSRP